MNELRMYVEHLFEGKVLTAENIELKEEIYGNLVARYEDYVASGLSEAEALEKTKASFTSVDDVLAEEGSSEEGAAQTRVMAGGAAVSGAVDGDANASAADVQSGEGVAPTTAIPRVEGAPVPPGAADGQVVAAPAPTRKRWPIVVGIIAAVAVVGLALMLLFNVVVEPAFDYAEDTVENVIDSSTGAGTGAQQGTSNGKGSGNGSGNGAGNQGTQQYIDPEDQREYETTTALVNEIADSPVTPLQAYAGRANTSEVAALAAELPLGANLREAGIDTANAATAYLDYTEVSGDIEGDALDRALVYNVAAIFAVYPDISAVRATLQEAYDSQWDADTYLFDRTRVEQCFANTSGNAVTQLNSSLLESTDAWDQVKGCIMDHHEFAENVVDWSETN